MQIGIAGALVQMKVRITKIVTGKMNGKHASILNKTFYSEELSYTLFLVIGHCDKMTLGFLHVQPTFSNANKSASKMKPWFCPRALVENF